MNTQISIENLKCNGCAGSIKKGLKSFTEISEVEVDLENSVVKITHNELLPLESIKEKLTSMGYPEKGSVEGLEAMAANAKSYVSCAIGKFSN
jgi:copper chaperone